jgi:hypothetical protein
MPLPCESHVAPHTKQMIRTLTKSAQHQAIRELESPTASDYNVEDGESAYKYSGITRTESRDIIYCSTTSYSRVASMQESKKQAWLSSGVDFDMR